VVAAADLLRRSIGMSSRTFRFTAILALALSLGVSSILPAAASQAPGRAGSIIQRDLSLRTLMQHVQGILRFILVTKSDPPPPNHPGDPPPGQAGNREGSAGCPNGGPPPPGQRG
jgi:hypothetical protein